MTKRPDSSTVINHAQRLILNRDTLELLADVADGIMGESSGAYPYGYTEGIRDVLRWLAGAEPTPILRVTLDLE